MRTTVLIAALIAASPALAGTRVDNPPIACGRLILPGTRIENPPALGGGPLLGSTWSILDLLWGGSWLSRYVYGPGTGLTEPRRSP